MSIPWYVIQEGNTPGLNLSYQPTFSQPTPTSVSISVSIANLSSVPTSYSVTYTKIFPGDFIPYTQTITSESQPIIIDNLISGAGYTFKVNAKIGSSYGNGVIGEYYLSKEASVGSSTGSSIYDSTSLSDSTSISSNAIEGQLGSNKSYLTLTNSSTNTKSFSLAYRSFTAIKDTTSTTTTINDGEGHTENVNSYGNSYYSFGTSLFLEPQALDNKGQFAKQGGGFGFFIGDEGNTGYFIRIDSTSSAATQNQKSIRIIKAQGSSITVLADTQKTDITTLGSIFAGKSYAIDIKVKVSGTKITITAYINGFKITATDQSQFKTGKGPVEILSPTNNVALLCTGTKVIFDYAYGLSITEEKYNASQEQINVYSGQFSNDLLDTAFGNIIYDGDYNNDEINILSGTSIDEFGTVVREIFYTSIKYDSTVAYPLEWNITNRSAKILGSKLSNFGAEVYVLNNSSSTVPLSDGEGNSLWIYGNTLGFSGKIDYSTDESSDYSNKEPIVFESQWLQTLSDVKSLASWIKGKVVNKAKVVTVSIFGNPLISVGDIITINYPYQNLSGSEKFIVTNVSHTYNNGLETSLICRTL